LKTWRRQRPRRFNRADDADGGDAKIADSLSDPVGSGWGGSEALKVSEEEMFRE